MPEDSVRKSIEVSALEAVDLPLIDAALRLMNRTHGEGLFDRDYLVQRIRSPDTVVLIGYLGSEFVAVGYAEIVKSFDYFKPFDADIETRQKHQRVGLLRTLSVMESFQGQGIGQQMTRRRMEWMHEQRCQTILGVSWVSGQAHTSSRVFEKLGFRKVKEVEKFFYKEAIKHPFDCPGCKKQPCECSAVLYELSVNF